MSTAETTTHDALTAQLERLYSIERTLRSELRTLSTDVSIETLDDLRAMECRERLQYALDQHREETETHIERIERAFEALGAEPATRPVPELDGLIADKEAFNNVVLSDELRPLYYMELALQLQSLECTVYETTISLATALGDDAADEILEALEPNYDAERRLRADLESLADSDAAAELLSASRTDDAARESLDRSRRGES